MFWPFGKSDKTEKTDRLDTVLAERRQAEERLRAAMRAAQTEQITDIFKQALPRHGTETGK